MAKKFAEHNGLNLTQVNNDILEMWREKNVFWRSVDEREGCPQFVFFEGPPSANGHPGIHHVLARTIKDTFNRYKTMKGYQVKRKAGWDTHGLPVELGVEKELGITKADIDNNLRQQVYRDTVVAPAAVLQQGPALQGLHHPAIFARCRYWSELTRAEPAWLLSRCKGHHCYSAVQGPRS